MVAAGTVDEDIYLMGERKKEVNECVLNDTGKKEKDAASTISGTYHAIPYRVQLCYLEVVVIMVEGG